jgi:hypothetical protein
LAAALPVIHALVLAFATSYKVPPFDMTLYACPVGTFSDSGGTRRVIKFPTLTADLVAGQGFDYTFSTPDCTPDDGRPRSRR